jgi:hypothetical protein
MDNQTLTRLAAQLFFNFTHENIQLESVYSIAKYHERKPEVIIQKLPNYWIYRINKSDLFIYK